MADRGVRPSSRLRRPPGLTPRNRCYTTQWDTTFWWAAIPRERWPEDPEWRRQVQSRWHQVYGDRRQELVFIGIGLNEAAIRRRLNACLVGDIGKPAMKPDAWSRLADPFPEWRRDPA